MKKIMSILRFVWAVCFVLWYAVQGTIVGLFVDRNKYFRKRLAPSAKRLMDTTSATLEVAGLENLNPEKHYLFLGNHRSYTDIIVLFVAAGQVNRQFSFMAKKELFYIPFLGLAMKSMGMIGVERGKSSKALRSLIDAVNLLKEGKDLIIFPEGTRSNDGKTLSPFKKGSFTIAKRAGVDIAPFIIEGTEVYMPKGAYSISPAHVKITFLPTIHNEGQKDIELMEMTENMIKEALCQK